jgi:predicted ATPase with chaperone activity
MRVIQRLSCIDSGLRCLCSIDAHPGLLDEAEKLLHVRAPVIHDILRAALVTEVHDACRSVDTRPYRASHDKSTERFLRLLGSEVEKGGQAHEGNAGVVFCDDSDILRGR